MNKRDCIDDIDVMCFDLLLGRKNGINDVIETYWKNDSLVKRTGGNKSMARRLRRCLNIPEGFTGTICFSFQDSRLSDSPWIKRTDGGRYIQLR